MTLNEKFSITGEFKQIAKGKEATKLPTISIGKKIDWKYVEMVIEREVMRK